jgi:transcriptional regulator
MYIPEHFEETDQARIIAFVKENSFAIIVSTASGQMVATHAPLLLEREGEQLTLTGHVAIENPQAEALSNGVSVLCIFHGPHAYVSSRWYKEAGIPDWNYRAVHITGTVQVIKDDTVLTRLDGMMNYFESRFENPGTLAEIAAEKVNGYLAKSHVFEIQVQKVEAIARLSQNHGADGMRTISTNLKQQDDVSAMLIGFEMEQRARKK